MRLALALCLCAIAAACAQVTPIGPDHPAHADAPAAPLPPMSGLLAADAPANTSGAADSAATEIYTCPMHPEVTQRGPGKCPKCQMALVPQSSAKEEHSHVH